MIVIRRLGLTAYPQALEQMRAHVAARAVKRAEAPDELWLTEHEPVFTLGFAGRPEHLLAPGAIPVVATERGGQVTYHGPGQVVAYLLLDLRRRKLGVRALVCRLEQGIIDCLAGYGLTGLRKAGAPGIYVRSSLPAPEISAGRLQATGIAQGGEASAPLAKIASIGLKISGGLTWHGLAVNGCMDLEPFQRIDPCGYPGLRITDICSEAGAHFARGAGEAFLHPTNGNRDSAMAGRDADALEDLSDRLGTTLANAIDG